MFRFEMDRSEVQMSTDMSHDEERGISNLLPKEKAKRTCFGVKKNKIYKETCFGVIVRLLRRSQDSPTADTERPFSEIVRKFTLSEIFAPPREHVEMPPDIFSGISNGNKKCLEKFESNGTPISHLKRKGDSVLHLAAAWGHLELVHDFVSDFPCLLLLTNSSGKTPLHMAASGGHTAVVKAYVKMVTFASERLCTEESERERLNPYVLKDEDGNTALHYAIEGIHWETALCLVEANKDAAFLGNNKEISSLYMAVENGLFPVMKAILRTTVNLDSKLQGRKHLAHVALEFKIRDFIDFIGKEYPTLLDERDSEGRTCLSYAASIGYLEGVCIILEQSKKYVYICDQDGSFPIHTAAKNGHEDIIKEIIKRCPDSKHLLNNLGQNVLHVAATNKAHWVNNLWMKNKKLEHLCDGKDVDGNTPLHLAVINWNYHFIPWLAKSREILELRNKNGLKAWEIAELEKKPYYIYKERWTLALILYIAHSKGCITATSLTGSSEPLDSKDNRHYVNSLLVVAALVATVTFAAGFTIPGGFNTDNEKANFGRATLATNPTLWIFLLLNILAMQSSVATIGILIWAQLGDPELIRSSLHVALPLLLFSLLCMPLAFLFGVITAIMHVKWLLIIICIISGLFFFVAIFIFGPHVMLQRTRVSPKFSGYFLVTFMQYKDIFETFVDVVKAMFCWSF